MADSEFDPCAVMLKAAESALRDLRAKENKTRKDLKLIECIEFTVKTIKEEGEEGLKRVFAMTCPLSCKCDSCAEYGQLDAQGQDGDATGRAHGPVH